MDVSRVSHTSSLNIFPTKISAGRPANRLSSTTVRSKSSSSVWKWKTSWETESREEWRKKNHLLKTFDFPFICFTLCFIGDQHTNNCLWILQTSRKLHFDRDKYAAGDPIKMNFVPWDLGKQQQSLWHLSKMAHMTFSFLLHMFPSLSYTTYAAYLCVLICPWLLLSPSGRCSMCLTDWMQKVQRDHLSTVTSKPSASICLQKKNLLPQCNASIFSGADCV